MTRLVVGLGNPGEEYAQTRHNVGFHVLDHLAGEKGAELFRSARQLAGYTGPGTFLWTRLEDPDALLVRPQTFMNRSGRVLGPLCRFLWPDSGEEFDGDDAPTESLNEAPPPARAYPDLMVVYDDLDLPPARLRIRPHGGAGGHNGMRSIIEHLSSDQFPRLKVGIGRGGTDAARYVLQPFLPSEREQVEVAVAEAAEAILDWLGHGDLEACMTRFHSRWNQES